MPSPVRLRRLEKNVLEDRASSEPCPLSLSLSSSKTRTGLPRTLVMRAKVYPESYASRRRRRRLCVRLIPRDQTVSKTMRRSNTNLIEYNRSIELDFFKATMEVNSLHSCTLFQTYFKPGIRHPSVVGPFHPSRHTTEGSGSTCVVFTPKLSTGPLATKATAASSQPAR